MKFNPRTTINYAVLIGILLIEGVVFFVPQNAYAYDLCCQKQGGAGCYTADFCMSDEEPVTPAICSSLTGQCQLIKKPSGSGSSASSKSGGSAKPTPAPSKPSASGAAIPKKPAVFGAPTNLGDPNGTPGKSLFIPKCADTEGSPGGGCRDVGAFLALFVNYSNATFAIIGTAAFIFFIYGGVMLLISGGEAERVKKGRDAIVGAVIGIIITFAAQMLVRFVIQGLVPAQNQNPENLLEVKLPDSTTKAK